MTKKRDQLITEYFEGMHCMRHVLWGHHGGRHASGEKGVSLTRGQMGILVMMKKYDLENTNEIAKRFSMTTSAATQAVDRLVEMKLLKRTPDRKDRRKITVTLTEKGKKTLEHSKTFQHEKMKQAFDALTEKELETYVRLQRKMLDHEEKRREQENHLSPENENKKEH